MLVSPGGTRLLYRNVHATWNKLAASAGLGPGPAPAGPASMTSATRSPSAPCSTPTSPAWTARPRSRLLSIYLGHADPKATYWYYSDFRVIPIPAPLRA